MMLLNVLQLRGYELSTRIVNESKLTLIIYTYLPFVYRRIINMDNSISHFLNTLLVFTLSYFLLACSAAPPKGYVVTHDQSLNRGDGVLLLADICIQIDALGTADDYFVIKESKQAAEEALRTLNSFAKDSNIRVREEVFVVCGAKHGEKETIKVSEQLDASFQEVVQPAYIADLLSEDAEYAEAIQTVSTYAFERAAVDDNNKDEQKNKTLSEDTPSVKVIEFLQAADIIRNRTHASSVLFLGVLGNSKTSGNVAASVVGNVFSAVSTGLLTAGMGTGYWVAFAPGYELSGSILEGAYIDLETGKLSWSNAVKIPDDPINQAVWKNKNSIDLLFHDLFFQRKTTQ